MTLKAGCYPKYIGHIGQKGVKKAGAVLAPAIGVCSQVINTTRAFTEMSVPFAPAAGTFNKNFAPVHFVNLLGAPFELIKAAKNIKAIFEAPSYLKFVPALKVGVAFGNMLDLSRTGIWMAVQMGAPSIPALATASLAIGGAGLGLQALGIVLSLCAIHDINTQIKAVDKALNKDPAKKNYDAAFDVLLNPKTKNKIWRQKFFGVLDKGQKKTIQDIFDKHQKDEVKMDATLKTIKNRHIQVKRQHRIFIAIMIIGIVGMTLYAFGPGFLNPIAWGLMGIAGASSLALLAYSVAQQKLFEKALLKQLK